MCSSKLDKINFRNPQVLSIQQLLPKIGIHLRTDALFRPKK